VILYGLLVGLLMVPLTALGCLLVGVVVVLVTGPEQRCWWSFFASKLLVVRLVSRNSSRAVCLLEGLPFSIA
jgi:hypothetical protein